MSEHLAIRAIPLSVLLSALSLLAAPGARAQTWSPLGPEGGTVSALASAPSDANVVYAATLGGGVFVSGDGGASWQGPGGGLNGSGLSPSVLAVDPQNAAVAYATASDGIWKTATGGDFWVRFLAPSDGTGIAQISALAIDPVHPQIVYTGSDQGVFRSDNGGRRWAKRNAGLPEGARVQALDVDPGSPSHLVAAVFWSDSQAGLFRSLDSAATWTRLPGAPAADFSHLARVSQTLYGIGSGHLYRSDDDGTTWTSLPLAPASLPGRIESLAVDPHGAIYLRVRQRILVSADRGASFTLLGVVPLFETVLSLHAGRGGAVLVGTEDFGVLRLSGGAFAASNAGLTATPVRGLEVDPNDSRHLYAAILGGGLFESRNRGQSWLPHNGDLSTALPGQPAAFDTGNLALARSAPSRLFLAIDRGVAASTDGGVSWRYQGITDCTTPDLLAVDPRGQDLYASFPASPTCGRPLCYGLVSHDSGRTWSCLPKIYSLDAALVDPVNAPTVYLAADSAFFKSLDGGRTVTLESSSLGQGPALALAESPAAPRVLYAGKEFGGVWKSRDGGAHWIPTGPALPLGSVVALIVDPSDAQRVYAGVLGTGVFRSQDGGASWQPLGEGLPGQSFSGPLRLVGSGAHTLYAGTDGAGVWALTLP